MRCFKLMKLNSINSVALVPLPQRRSTVVRRIRPLCLGKASIRSHGILLTAIWTTCRSSASREDSNRGRKRNNWGHNPDWLVTLIDRVVNMFSTTNYPSVTNLVLEQQGRAADTILQHTP